jgi:hypothetical protein
MNTHKLSSLFAICGALGLFGGCATEPESHLVTAPPPPPPTAAMGVAPAPQPVIVTQPQQVLVTQPQQVYTTAAVPTTANSYIVMQAPPAPQPEAVPPRPSNEHVWVAGYWTWQNSRYAWMAGHWVVPPSSTAVWVNPRWEPEGGAFRFYEGYWN